MNSIEFTVSANFVHVKEPLKSQVKAAFLEFLKADKDAILVIDEDEMKSVRWIPAKEVVNED